MPDIFYTGDRGSGKTTALVLRFCALLDEGVDARDIQVLSGQQYESVQHFKSLVFRHRPRAILGLRIHTHRHLARQIIDTILCDALPSSPILLNTGDLVMLLQQHYEAHREQFFPGHLPTPGFFEHLLRRHQRCAQQLLWGETLKQRSQRLELEPLAFQANLFLEHFSQSLQQRSPALLDPLAQAQYLHSQVQRPEVQAHFGANYWIIDNLEETRPLDQHIVEHLSHQHQQRICSWNPQGGIVLGAYRGYAAEQAKQAAEEHILSRQRPLHALAHNMFVRLQHLPELVTPPATTSSVKPALKSSVTVHMSQHAAEMYATMAQNIKGLLAQGVAPHEITCVTWYLDALSAQHLKSHFEEQGIPTDLLQGRQALQRSPWVNVLLSLLRLVFWPYFQPDPNIPRLTGFDMAQIFRICGGLDAFTVSDLRFRFGNNLEDWGAFLQESAADMPRLARLQTCIQSLRALHPNPTVLEFDSALHTLWNTQVLPYIPLENDGDRAHFYGVQQLMQRLHRQCELAPAFDPADASFFWQQVFAQNLQVYGATPPHSNRHVKVMTAHRLGESEHRYRYQLWFDLTNPSWFRPLNHPIDNALVLQQHWPLDQPWSLQAEEDAIEERLAICWRKGLLCCEEQAFFYACLYDHQARMQREEGLIYALEDSSETTV
jgi:hypothetical protein